MSSNAPATPQPQFPTHSQPRVWFVTAATSPIGTAVVRNVLAHGDYVVAGILPYEYEKYPERCEQFYDLWEEVAQDADAEVRGRLKVVGLDIKALSECQSAVAEALEAFQRIDILFCCNSEALIGTIEELSQSIHTQSLVTDQFQTNYFGPVNIIKTVLPCLRENRDGHIILLTGITGHLGTPGLGMYCSSQWAIEGYCDSLAYEIAPFNVRMSIVQSNIEVALLTNKITSAPPLPAYASESNPAPLSRGLFANLLDRLDTKGAGQGGKLRAGSVEALYPRLPGVTRDALVAETVHAVTAIGGHANPPARHIVGQEGVLAVKEKLRTVSEELEDFVEVSSGVDF